ncbi:porphobilinogen deaminase [Teratosphaeria nubilosa]|uniref:Porphobilinogen deaminase n=1 Tax=Teratosphaeria nubilosa TaxID=161662 RepID=A0A6G1KVR7_9PEZI|nr:porphobilinogen deaminase [Teratosphaeria nubilosa]
MASIPSDQKPVRIGTRKSNLAVIQAQNIRRQLESAFPHRSFEIYALPTLGDKDQSTALYNFGDKSLWTTELEELLTSGQLDIIVHCLKDMPNVLPATCELAAIPARDDPRDALVIKTGLLYTTLASLPEGAVVGTSLVRRIAQLRRRYPKLRFANLRGNVETRLAKVDRPETEYSCMVMSTAGLQRVGLEHLITQYLGTQDWGIMHAVGQGALGLEIRRGDVAMKELLGVLGDERTTLACTAERALMRTLEGGCSVPIGVETAWLTDGEGVPASLEMAALVVGLDGSQKVESICRAEMKNLEEANDFGKRVAEQLLEAGADAILRDINRDRPSKD